MDAPDKLSSDDSVLLGEMVKNFPYFQTAHLLYTKSLHNQNSIHYNNQLKLTAAYATSRKRLHELITKKTIVEDSKETAKTENSIIEHLVKEETVAAKPVITTFAVAESIEPPINNELVPLAEKSITEITNNSTDSIAPEIKAELDEVIVEKTIIETPVIAGVEAAELPVKNEIIIPVEETTIEINNIIEEPILSEITVVENEVEAEKTIIEYRGSDIVEASELPVKTEVVTPVTETVPPANSIVPATILIEITEALKEAVAEKTLIEAPVSISVDSAQLPIQNTAQEESAIAIPEKRSQELEKNYLHEAAIASVEIDLANTPLHAEEASPLIVEETNFVLNTPDILQEVEKTEERVHIEKEQEENDFNVAETHTFGEWLKHLPTSEKVTEQGTAKIVKEKPKTETTGLKKSKNDLIDKFLKEEPRIKPRAEFFSPANVAKQSVAEDITFVSETLAKIYLLQENYNKAIEAYENLRLKYPEKRLYFATQIKKIRKLIHPTN
jgi:hypothetical protein